VNLKYRFVEYPTVPELLSATANKAVDVSVAAITITAEREKTVDFSQPFYTTGLGIAVPIRSGTGWLEIARTLTSFGFLQALLALVAVALGVGGLVSVFERRHLEDFGGPPGKGLGTSIWWSAEAMTQASTGKVGPKTFAGRAVAIIWMIGSIIAIAVFTASVTSAMTTRQMQGLVSGVSDLPNVRVGAIVGSATVDFLTRERIPYRGFASAHDGLKALESGTLDAFVYDRPILAFLVQQQFSGGVEVLDVVFDRQSYGMAMPLGGGSRKAFDLALLEAVQSDWWRETLYRYLGETE
jgi:ABC-type amino acid transport substrate-binding protein